MKVNINDQKVDYSWEKVISVSGLVNYSAKLNKLRTFWNKLKAKMRSLWYWYIFMVPVSQGSEKLPQDRLEKLYELFWAKPFEEWDKYYHYWYLKL